MYKFELLLIGLVAVCGFWAIANGKVIICYVSKRSLSHFDDGKFEISDIDPHMCTHLSYSFYGVSNSGEFNVVNEELELDSDNEHIDQIAKLKETNPNLKVMAVVGGWATYSQNFSEMIADPAKTKLFIDSTLDFLNKHNLDGLDISWFYFPDTERISGDSKNFVNLLKELKAVLQPLNKELHISVPPTDSSVGTFYDIPAIAEHVDFICVLAFNFVSYRNEMVGFKSPLRGQGEKNVESTLNHLLDQGAPASSLILSVGFYALTAGLADPGKYSLGSKVLGAGKPGPYTNMEGLLSYYEVCLIKDKWSYEWDEEGSVPFLHESNQFISYENVESVGLKMDLVNSLNLAGVSVWLLDVDDFSGRCGEKYPLMNVINKKLRN